MPATKRRPDVSVTSAPTMAELLRGAFPTHTAKRASTRWLSHRTVQDWVQRRCCPSADTLLRLAMENEQLRAELLRRLGGHGYGGMEAGNAPVGGEVAAGRRRAAGDVGGPAGPATPISGRGRRGLA